MEEQGHVADRRGDRELPDQCGGPSVERALHAHRSHRRRGARLDIEALPDEQRVARVGSNRHKENSVEGNRRSERSQPIASRAIAKRSDRFRLKIKGQNQFDGETGRAHGHDGAVRKV